jgi:alginate O-acetyltransferase complex protein AlgI
MIFNSLSFAIFFSVFFLLYWFVFNRNLRAQNFLLLVGSYLFYAWWDWRFLSLLIGSSFLNYYLGISINKASNEIRRRIFLYLGLIQGLGTLLIFKYLNFFISSFVSAFSVFNVVVNIHLLNLILPLGISFYTFRTISYLLDIDNGKIKPSLDWVVFFSYVSFFPSLISGPIDRPKALIPQLENIRSFDYNHAADGLRQILWGLFKKIVIADNCAEIANKIFDNYLSIPSSSLLLGTFLYTIQVYADFSGYSDMAIGFSRLLGFNISRNFNFPFFSQNIAEYWRSWHISLTTWMTEYVFTPLSFTFRSYSSKGLIFAIIINFILVGIWHGANWTFVLFGFMHGCYFIPLIIKGTINSKRSVAKNKLTPSFIELRNILLTFTLVMFTNIIFRAESITKAFEYYHKLFSFSEFSKIYIYALPQEIFPLILMIALFLCIEWLGRENEYAIADLVIKLSIPMRWAFYYAVIILIVLMGGKPQEFIYFQF